METVILTVFDILNLVLILFLWVYTLKIFQKRPIGYPGVSKVKSSCLNTPGRRFLASGDQFWTIVDEI